LGRPLLSVITGLDPVISMRAAEITGSSPVMTIERVIELDRILR